MKILDKLRKLWHGIDYPFLIHSNGTLSFSEIEKQSSTNLSEIQSGDVVALIGDFDPLSIRLLLQLIDKKAIIVPLSNDTKAQHQYFFNESYADFVIEGDRIEKLKQGSTNTLLEALRVKNHAGLILFTTGTTGRPKAILHDLTLFLQRFETPRPSLKTLNFLLFDHIGGINTLLHTLFNKGTVVAPSERTVESILKLCSEHEVEVLPTTPTFLRLMLMSGMVPDLVPETLRVITYGTERMDQPTLDALCTLLPNVDFRQTFGMSELGIVRVKSISRDSLYMKIGGEGVETRVRNNILEIRSKTRMLGYLNAESPFDSDGWYNTKDIVEQRDDAYRVVGRISEVINVGGLKFMASEVERIVLQFPGVELAKVVAKNNPITGQHVELSIQAKDEPLIDKGALKKFIEDRLPKHMVPKRIKIGTVDVGHRFKRA